MITKEFKIACREINQILELLDDYEANKIPDDIKNVFKQAEDEEYNSNIDPNIPIEDQNITKKTKDILVYLYVNYLCENEDKNEIIQILNENYELKQAKLREKYNPDEVFKQRRKKNIQIEDELMLIEYKESIFKRIINRIKKMFKIDS